MWQANQLSMQWQANPKIEALASYSLTRLHVEYFETVLPKLGKAYACRTTKSGSLHAIYTRYDAP